jgi:heat shock protein HspQ
MIIFDGYEKADEKEVIAYFTELNWHLPEGDIKLRKPSVKELVPTDVPDIRRANANPT